jgi:signal transduction histidine kinase
MKTRRLLNKTLHYYLLFGLLITIVTAPVFYIVMKKNHIHEMDELLLSQREMIVENSLKNLKTEEIQTWNNYNKEASILPYNGQQKKNIFKTEQTYNKQENEYEAYRSLSSIVEINEQNYILYIRLNIFETLKILRMSVLAQLFLFVFLMAGFIITTLLIHKRLWKPFFLTLSLTKQFNISRHKPPVFPASDTHEFEQLKRALAKLIENNLQAYQTQKEFTENASHEMQTPLAVFRSKLDLLLQQPELTKEQLQIIHILNETTSRLVHTNKNLLLLAQIDNMQLPDTKAINVHDILIHSLSLLSEQANLANITIATHITDRSPILNANQTLLESLINNLLTNAIKHNTPTGGKIIITLETKRFVIANTGIVMNPLDSNILFSRFGRMNPAAKGSGLGLAIARQICANYGWQIDYAFDEGMHVFEVVFF